MDWQKEIQAVIHATEENLENVRMHVSSFHKGEILSVDNVCGPLMSCDGNMRMPLPVSLSPVPGYSTGLELESPNIREFCRHRGNCNTDTLVVEALRTKASSQEKELVELGQRVSQLEQSNMEQTREITALKETVEVLDVRLRECGVDVKTEAKVSQWQRAMEGQVQHIEKMMRLGESSKELHCNVETEMWKSRCSELEDNLKLMRSEIKDLKVSQKSCDDALKQQDTKPHQATSEQWDSVRYHSDLKRLSYLAQTAFTQLLRTISRTQTLLGMPTSGTSTGGVVKGHHITHSHQPITHQTHSHQSKTHQTHSHHPVTHQTHSHHHITHPGHITTHRLPIDPGAAYHRLRTADVSRNRQQKNSDGDLLNAQEKHRVRDVVRGAGALAMSLSDVDDLISDSESLLSDIDDSGGDDDDLLDLDLDIDGDELEEAEDL